MWSSVVPAEPWTTRPDCPEIAAASSSESIDLAVPGSPTIIRPCAPMRLTMARSTRGSSP